MALTLYDLAGEEDARRFSPYCWRAKLCLLHKGLTFETVPWRFTEREALAFSGQGAVPVLVDGEQVIANSWAIAQHLEDAYPDRPSLFGGAAGRGLASFLTEWVERGPQPLLAPAVSLDVWRHLHPKDRDYYRRTREERYGAPLEALAADAPRHLAAFRAALAPLRGALEEQPYLSGAAPLYADYAAFGPFAWARSVSKLQLLEADDPVEAWRRRMLEACGGAVGRSPGY